MGGRLRTVSGDPPEGFATWRAFLDARIAAGGTRLQVLHEAVEAGCARENARKRLVEILGPAGTTGAVPARRPPPPHRSWKEFARALERSGVGRAAAREQLEAAGCADGTVDQVLRDAFPPEREAMRLPDPIEDTRCLTGRMFGDPLPGRSALDQRRGA